MSEIQVGFVRATQRRPRRQVLTDKMHHARGLARLCDHHLGSAAHLRPHLLAEGVTADCSVGTGPGWADANPVLR
jgi:hypothetical protein